ncbi:MAG: alpha/beta fold hydrolase [Actinomycetota bacterium]|nr:alpha/beta fold hydrolase [Actinomycetota bacterium]
MARILCLHGLGGTARTMQPLVDALTAAGHTVHAPTLPGHGGVPDDLVGVGWAQWLAAAAEWPADVVVGQSMGGVLAFALSLQHGCRAVVAINPPAPDPDAVDGLEWRQSRGHDWVDGPPLAEGEEGYTRLPITALIEMADGVLATGLAGVKVPVLLVTSAYDDVVDPDGAELIAASLGGLVQRLLLPNSGHVATLGPDRELLAEAIAAFA